MECQLCSANYINLPDLVSHFRASHSHDEFVCNVSQCPKIFRNANTWYKHVLKRHMIEYLDNIIVPSSEISEVDDGEQCCSNNDTPDNLHPNSMDISISPDENNAKKRWLENYSG